MLDALKICPCPCGGGGAGGGARVQDTTSMMERCIMTHQLELSSWDRWRWRIMTGCPLHLVQVDASQQAVIFTWFKLMHHDRLSSSPGSGWHIRTDCHLTWFKLMHHDRLSTCTGWRLWPILTCQLKLSSWAGDDDSPSWCCVIRSCPIMTLCDQEDCPSWCHVIKQTACHDEGDGCHHGLLESCRIGAVIWLQKCQKFLLCSLNKYYGTRFTMVH